jgi:RNA polymerase sigma-70 factor (ECF subfamily)
LANRIDIHRLADEDLMHLVQTGRPDAFEAIYDRHGGVAFSLAYRMAGRRALAEDIVQEAFLSVWRSRERFQRERGSVRSWLLGIVHNRAVDGLRRTTHHERRIGGDDEVAERREAPERTELEAVRRDEARSVRAALEELPADQTKVIELAYYGGYTHTEIAGMLEEPVGTVKGRMRLGLEKMRRQLVESAA